MADKEEKVYLARLAEQAERYEGIIDYLTIYIFLPPFLLQNFLLAASNMFVCTY